MMSNSLILIAISCLSFLQHLHASYHTCGDWMSSHDKNSLSNGVYNITSIIDRESDSDNWREVYCDFDYTRNYAWTLIESGSRSSYSSTLYQTAFINSVSYNEDDVYTYRTSLYRLSREWVYSLYFLSDYLYATCNFDTSFSQDWLLFSLDDSTLEYNPFYDEFSGQCVTAISANIRGYLCQDTTVQVWSTDGTWHLHIDSSSTSCGCTSWATGATSSEDNFGYYQVYNTEFTCTASSSSTTNYWFGSYVSNYKTPTLSPTEIPSIEPSDIPSNTPTDKPSSHPSDIPSDSPTNKPSINPSVLPTLSPTESIIVPTCEPSYSYSSEILECAKICVNNSMTTDEKSDLTTTATSGLTDDSDNSGGNEQSNSSSNDSSSSDGLSTELIVILSVIGVLVFLCCIFCLFFTGVVSWHVRKRDEKMLQISANANNNNMNNNNINNNNNNSKHSLLAPVASNSAMLYETNGSQQLFATNSMNNSMNNNNNNGNNNPNGVNKEGPQITWQELATIHALTSRAMQLGNAPQNPNVNGISDIGNIINKGKNNNNNNNNNNNGNNNKGQSQIHFGENANGNGFDNNDNDNDNDDDIYNNKNNNNENKDDAALTVAMNLAFNENENNINNNNNNDNDLLAEGGIGGN